MGLLINGQWSMVNGKTADMTQRRAHTISEPFFFTKYLTYQIHRDG